MLRILTFLVVMAAATMGAAALWDPATRPALDPLSVAVGIGGGLFLGWLRSLPWAELPAAIKGMLFRWTRGFGLLGLAALAASILLYY